MKRPFEDPFVLNEIATLLSGDRGKILTYLTEWNESAVKTYARRLSNYQRTEQLVFGPKSITQADPSVESDMEMVLVTSVSDGSLSDVPVADQPSSGDEFIPEDEEEYGSDNESDRTSVVD